MRTSEVYSLRCNVWYSSSSDKRRAEDLDLAEVLVTTSSQAGQAGQAAQGSSLGDAVNRDSGWSLCGRRRMRNDDGGATIRSRYGRYVRHQVR